MNPTLILFGIRSIVRLGQVGRAALEQWARDKEAIFPELKELDFDKRVHVNNYFTKADNIAYVVGDNADYKEHWDGVRAKSDATSIDILFTASIKIESERGNKALATDDSVSYALVKQWDEDKGPVSPWTQIILTAGDIALEYVAIDPTILGVGGNGEKLLGAYAKNLSDILPDNGQFGDKEDFAQRLVGVFLRSGFKTISQNPEWVVSEQHLQELISESVKPLLKDGVFPASITEQLKWQKVIDTVMGPVADAALKTIANNPEAFLGDDLSADKAVGAVTRALLTEAAETGLLDQFTKEGLVGLYQAALNVVVERPQLFLGDGTKPADKFAKDLLVNFAAVLKDTKPPFDGDVGIKLASAALDAVGKNAHRFADGTDEWEQVAADMVKKLTGDLKKAFDENGKIELVFSKTQLVEMGRIIFTRVANSPGMILGTGKNEWHGVVTAVATAMKEDKNLLLSGDDWIEIVKVAAQEAAANPARLFRLDPNNPKDVLAGKLISKILSTATAVASAENQKDKNVLIGNTLKEVIIIVLRAASGNSKFITTNLDKIEDLINKLSEFIAEHNDSYGSKEWLRLFRELLSKVMEGEEVPLLSVESVNNILQGA